MPARALSREEARAIFRDPRDSTEVAAEYAVSSGLVRQIRTRRAYVSECRGMRKVRRVRGGKPCPARSHPGEAHGRARLRDVHVRWLRRSPLRGTDLYHSFVRRWPALTTIHPSTLQKAQSGASWRHL